MELQLISHSSPLGDWHTAVAVPTGRTQTDIALMWDVAGTTNYARESILPTGHIELIFNLGDDQFLLDADDLSQRTTYRSVWISGLQQQPLLIESDYYSHLVGVRFTPLGAWRFFGIPLDAITDHVLHADTVIGNSLLLLREQFADFSSPARRLRHLMDFIKRRMSAAPVVHAAVAEGMHWISQTGGQGAVADLVKLTGYSQKHLHRKFREQVGLVPKRIAQLVKFQHALARLQSNPSLDFGELAVQCGYYDQAHFNHEFRRYAGASPSSFLAQRLPDDITASMVVD